MSLAQYEIYRSKVMALARSMIIKCSPAATAINNELELQGQNVNLADPASWKYYLNLNGEYHATDRVMTVTSLDTLQTIEFKKETLALHQITRREYVQGSRYYEALVSRFPDQESLIQGILNPIDIQRAIAAKDGEILYYDATQVEGNETNLIPMLNDWTTRWWRRWVVPAYAFPDDLYISAMFGRMVMMLPAMIEIYRVRNCFTQYAHSFHIRQHLASNGRLDSFVDYLTYKQMLWLYRNVIWLHRNAGKQETFQELVQHVMTDRSMPLSEWDMTHNTEHQSVDIYPKIEFQRKPINELAIGNGRDMRSIPNMLDAEQPLARNNIVVQPQAEEEIKLRMENSIRNQLKTKILESSITDLSDSTAFTLPDVLLNQWLYWSDTNQYQAVISVENPKIGGTFTLDVREAFYVFLYAYNLSMGIRLPNIPPLQAQMVRKQPRPMFDEVLALTDSHYVDRADIEAIYAESYMDGNYISIPAFHEACLKIHRAKNRQREIYSSVSHYLGRGQAEGAMHYLYWDVPVLFEVGTPYETWLRDLGLDVATYSELEAGLLAEQIYITCTGLNLITTQSTRDIQAAMLRLMSRLSSYTVQYLQTINTSPVKTLDWPLIRPGDADRYAYKNELALTVPTTVLKIDEYRQHELHLDNGVGGQNAQLDVFWRNELFYDIDLDIEFGRHAARYQTVGLGGSEVLNVQRSIPVLGTDTPIVNTDQYLPAGHILLSNAFMSTDVPYYTLSSEDHDTITQRYQTYLLNAGEFLEPINDVLPIRNLGYLWPYVQGPEETT